VEQRAHSIKFIHKVIEVLRSQREPDSEQSLLEGRLATIETYYEQPGYSVPSKHWLDDEDIEEIHQALGTPVAFWNTNQSRTRGRLIRPQMHMSAAEAANFLDTPKTWIEASPSHYTCFGHSVGKLKALPDHTPMRGTVREETLRQATFLLARASQNRAAIKKTIEAQRRNPREARAAARNLKTVATSSKKGPTKNIRPNPKKPRTRRTGEPVRAGLTEGLPQQGGEAPETPSPAGPPRMGGEGQGIRTPEGSPLGGGEAVGKPTASLPHRGEQPRGRRDQ
jgi:hypothetical protein